MPQVAVKVVKRKRSLESVTELLYDPGKIATA
jgi:hypothetical protein